jgi:gliding motility-associated-like protein
MKKIKLLLFILIITLKLWAQKEFNVWHFGQGASVNFNNTPPTSGGSNVLTVEGTSAVSDCEGKLLFYTDGVTVWNRTGAIMSNGSGLLGYQNNTSTSLIVKVPKSKSTYYIFTTSLQNGLRYSIVNMNGDNGLGNIIQKNIQLNNSSVGRITVAYHANGIDIWVLVHYNNSLNYHAFLVTELGIELPGIISQGILSHSSDHGDMIISPDGKKVACTLDNTKISFNGSLNSRVSLADFNNENGRVNNEAWITKDGNPHGCAFSPNSNYLYINSTNDGVIRYDLSNGSNAQVLSTSISLGGGSIYGSLRLGPDGNIYVADYGSNYLGRVNNPNLSFTSYNSFGIDLGSRLSGYGIINTTLTSPPTFSGPNNIIFAENCFGDPVEFRIQNTSNIIEVNWNFGDPASGVNNTSSIFNPTHEFSGPGSYNVTLEILYECGSETINRTIVIEESPHLNLTDTLKICANTAVNIGVNPVNNYIYNWSPANYLNQTNISNPTFIGRNYQEETILNYKVTVTTPTATCFKTYDRFIRLVEPILNPGPSREICSEDTINVGFDKRNNYVYNWTPSNLFTQPDSAITKTFNANPSNADQMNVLTLAATFDGCTLDSSIFILYKAKPNFLQPKQQFVCSNAPTTLNTLFNVAPDSVQWLVDEYLDNFTAPQPVFTHQNLSDTIQKIALPIFIRNRSCTSIDTFTVYVYPQSGIDNYQFLCPGFGAKLNPFGWGTQFTWSPNQFIDDVNSKNPIVNPDVSKWYFVSITDSVNCTYNDSVFVDVNPKIPIDLPNDTVICFGDSIGVGLKHTIQNATFSWSPSMFTSHPDSSFANLFPNDTMLFYLTVTKDTCSNSDSILIKVIPLPLVEIVKDTTICFGDTISLFAQGALSYQWMSIVNTFVNQSVAKVFPSQTQKYWVLGTDVNNCKNSDTVLVEVLQLPNINIPNDTNICFGQSVNLNVQTVLGDYQWLPTQGVNNPNAINIVFSPNQTTKYFLNVQDTFGCKNKDSILIQVNPLPNILSTKDTLVCDSVLSKFWVSGGEKYMWYPQNLFANNSLATQNLRFTEPSELKVVVATDKNCTDSVTIKVNVNDQPKANLTYTIEPNCDGFLVKFKDESTLADEWKWNFGDGKSSNNTNPQHTFNFGTKTTTQLIVGNNKTCFDTATINWDFKNPKDFIRIDAPNIITPNNDKLNECFEYKINGEFNNCASLEVFNRWGLKIYDSKEFSGCFNGYNFYNNQKLASGTYFYVISINDYKANGFIQVISE